MVAPGSVAGAVPYVYYVACSTSKSAPPATTCSKASDKAAFFKSNLARPLQGLRQVPDGTKLCAKNQDAPKGVKKVNPITSTMKGPHKVKWYVGGDQVGSYNFTVN